MEQFMQSALPIIPAGFLLAALLWADNRGVLVLRLAAKTLLSGLFVAVAWFQPGEAPFYYLLLVGLILGLVGDVCLGLPAPRAFVAGLGAFLLGHLAYVAAFIRLGRAGAWFDPWALGVLAVAGLALLGWLLPMAGRMRLPLIAYVCTILLMLDGAWAVFHTEPGVDQRAAALLAGAVLFAVSDFFVARQRFVAAGFVNRAVGLPLYYTGQFLIAFACGML